MFRLALAALRSIIRDSEVLCVVLQEHEDQFGISAQLLEAEASIKVVPIMEVTGGSLETCLAAAPLIRGGGLVILDCDLTFSAPRYLQRLQAMGRGEDDSAGLLLSFRSRLPQYSYAEVGGGRVLRTAEKQPISDRALIGAYGFGQATQFFAIARDIVARNLRTGNGEYYVSSVYNELITQGGVVGIEDVEHVWSVGTPEELATSRADPAFRSHLTAIGLNPQGD